MSWLKGHFSVILSLCVLLFSFQLSILFNKALNNYEGKISQDYAIAVSSKEELKLENLNKTIKSIRKIEEISSNKVLGIIEKNLPITDINNLKQKLPFYYSLKLNYFPSSSDLEDIKNQLLKVKGINKIETFSHTYDKIYQLLVFLKIFLYIFTALISVIAILLISNQMSIWIYQHKERIEIMSFFGASSFSKNMVLYKMAIVDSILATFIVISLFYFLPHFEILKKFKESVDFIFPKINLIYDSAFLMLLSLIFTISIVRLVAIRIKRITS